MHEADSFARRPSARPGPSQLREPVPPDCLPSESHGRSARFQTVEEVMQDLSNDPPKAGQSRTVNIDPSQKTQLILRLESFARGKGYNWGVTNGGNGAPGGPIIIRFLIQDSHPKKESAP